MRNFVGLRSGSWTGCLGRLLLRSRSGWRRSRRRLRARRLGLGLWCMLVEMDADVCARRQYPFISATTRGERIRIDGTSKRRRRTGDTANVGSVGEGDDDLEGGAGAIGAEVGRV